MASFLLILLIPSFGIGYFSFDSARDTLRDQIHSSAETNVRAVNQMIEQYIQPVVKETELLSEQLSTDSVDNQDREVRKRLDQWIAKHPEIELVTIGNHNGAWMKAPDPGKLEYDPRQRDWYIQAMSSPGRITISKPYPSTTTKKPVITIAQTFPDGKGAVGFNLDLQKLSEMLHEVKIGQQGYVYLLDGDSKYIVHPKNPPGTAAAGSQYEYMLKNDSGTIAYRLNGKPKEALFATNALTGWKIAGTMEVAEYSEAARPILIRTVEVVAGSILVFSLMAWLFLRTILGPLRELQQGADRIKAGDLGGRIRLTRRDEFGALGGSFNEMAASLSALVREMADTSGQLAASSQQMTAITEQTADSVQHVTESIQQVAGAGEIQSRAAGETSLAAQEMAEGIQKVASAAGEMAASAAQSERHAQAGGAAVQELSGQMMSIRQAVDESADTIAGLSRLSAQIRDMNDAIANMAGQTNILSLNASIEAARAGEHGRGFAVVAEEIRKLADQSKRTADNIQDVILQMAGLIDAAAGGMSEKVAKEMDKGSEVTLKVGSAFRDMEESTERIVGQIHDVTAVAEQMSANAEEVAAAMEEISSSAQQAASHIQSVSAASEEQLASMEELTSSSAHLSGMAEKLQRMIDRFTL
ncbi:methyl-accepting chemotaxis protein [Paenibacillus aurantius]|uniref:Methyl-accepting chemotaxis protein n=1 Tax=Paenibacillus aurantius TaxID=2918900 RepID=A0AA96LAG6_9BACL|nr:methyl-accepting chemotaxis protein [Paenibacillus aurantius]WNQ09529.1 methyl-accepting chemotaxis protein [Paenibacillus aurantius]